MYSILIQTTASSGKYTYYLNSDSTVYTTNSLIDLGTKVAELLQTYVGTQIVPIKNCVITNNVVIAEATN